MLWSRVLSVLFFFLPVLTLVAQQPVAIRPGEVISASFDSSSTEHTYTIELEAGTFVYGEAEQRSVDVVVDVLNAANRRIGGVDISGRGPDSFTFEVVKAGLYRIRVTPFRGATGDYSITLHRVEPVATTLEGIADQLMAPFNGNDRPGGVIGVIRNGEVEFVRTWGMADLTHGVPNTPETLFNIGSVSKQFAGIFFAMMAEEGRLSLDDDVRKYLPELPDFGDTVRLRHLLNHTSGYREAYGPLGLQGRFVSGDLLRRQDAIDVVRYQPKLQFPPSSRHLYNSTGYVLLTTIAERITGELYPDWMQQNVFDPLGMPSTIIEREPGQVIPGAATSYRNASHEGYREDFEAYAYYGATDVYTNVEDLAHWIRNFRTGEPGGPGVMERMMERPILSNGDTLTYTLGLRLDRHLGMERVQHGGSTGGYRTFLAWYPEVDLAIVVMANTGAVPVQEIAEEIAEVALLGGVRGADLSDLGSISGTDDSVRVSRYTGSYWVNGKGRIEIGATDWQREGRSKWNPTITIGRRPSSWLQPTGENRNQWETGDYLVTFIEDNGGAVNSAVVGHTGEGEYSMFRIDPLPEDTEIDLLEYEGRYFSKEVETVYSLSVVDGRLQLEHRRLGTIPLRHEAINLFLAGWPIDEVIFERDASGSITGFRVNNDRMLGVEFDRVE